MKTITVNVTERDIERGCPRSFCACPVAIALRRVMHSDGIEVHSDVVCAPDMEWEEPLPERVQERIAAWDETQDMKPFRFELALPDEAFASASE